MIQAEYSTILVTVVMVLVLALMYIAYRAKPKMFQPDEEEE